uniref:CUE domain-containing protein n=1 Tax=Sphenodon punctatus TaxID=8508 RepID=A0A8D0GT50_SPHPU
SCPRWLPPISREAEEPREEFALRVQELLAVELGVVSTRLTAADKAEYVKRMRHNPPTPHPPGEGPRAAAPAAPGEPPPHSASGAEDGHVTGLAQRVQEVLPHVPLSAICRDLAQTHCVDTTIANLLEEQVPFTPPAADPETKAALLGTSTPGLQHSAAPLPAKVPGVGMGEGRDPVWAAPAQHLSCHPPVQAPEKLFARSPVERHMSLQERKQALYDSARRKFTQKHKTPQAEGSC